MIKKRNRRSSEKMKGRKEGKGDVFGGGKGGWLLANEGSSEQKKAMGRNRRRGRENGGE